jgi:hypothetical protein
MATDRMALLEQLGKAAAGGDVDFLRQAVKTMAEALMELDVAAMLRADPHERTPDRVGYRNGHRSRDWDTRTGTIQLDIPKLRLGQRFDESDGPMPARLLVTFASDGRQESWPIIIHRISVIGILVPELVAAVMAGVGPIRGVGWRPWLETELQPVIGRRWPAPPRIGDPARHLAEYATVEDRVLVG